jgi:hypothetical protein
VPLINAINVIQWVLYYPAVVDPEDLGVERRAEKDVSQSLEAYQRGDLLAAMNSYPESHAPTGGRARLLRRVVAERRQR